MNNDFSVKNFRVFDEKGVSVPIKPITILTGCNSSGKSSIVKSMVLLDTYLKGLLTDFNDSKNLDLNKYKLDFSSGETALLGGFDRVLHRKSRKPHIELGYSIHSLLLGEDVNVIYRFCKDKNDALNNGYFQGFSIMSFKDDTIYSSFNKETNYALIKNSFFRYIIGQYIIYENKSRDYNNLDNSYYDTLINKFNEAYSKNAIADIIKRENILPQIYLRLAHKKSLVQKYLNNDLSLLENAKKYGTLFYVPILKILFQMTKEKVRLFEGKLEKEGKTNEYICNVFRDFYSSKYGKFGNYYLNKEYEYFKSNIYDEDKNTPISICLNNWTLTANYRHSDDNIVHEVFRYNEPTIDFVKVYDALLFISSNLKSAFFDLCSVREAKIFEMFKDYLSQVFEEVHTTAMPHNLSYVGSSIVNLKKLYSLEGTDSFTVLLKNYFSAKRSFINSNKGGEAYFQDLGTYRPGLFMNKWLRKFGLGDSIKMTIDETQTGVAIRLFESETDKRGTLLSEQGYGVTQLFVILLRIETALLESKRYCSLGGDCLTNPLDLIDNPNCFVSSTIAIEEPEIHQHPKFQSMLADIFVDAYVNYNIHFIIETHSEYLIRKLQNLVAKGHIDTDEISLIYVNDLKKRVTREPQLKTIGILSDGRLADTFGHGFFDEADKLAMNLLNIKVSGDENA